MSLTRFPLDQPVVITIDTFSDVALTVPGDPTTLDLSVLAQDATPPTETDYTWAGGGLTRTALGVFTWTPSALASGNYAYHGKATGAVATGLDGRFKVLAKYAIDVTVADLARYLSNPSIDADRAQVILDEAHELCETIIDPLPPRARSVVLDVAERAYAIPPEGVGPFATITPTTMGNGGLWLTRNNKATLRRLSGGGTAFSIDMLPTNLAALPAWDIGDDEATLLELP